jgi:hypothetical protein
MSILRNEVYIGSLVMGKTKTNPLQMRKPVRVAKSEWIICPEHHRPIINAELFRKVQLILDNRKKIYDYNKHIAPESDYLGSRLFCGDCGRKMKMRHTNGITYYICPRYAEAKGACTAKRIKKTEIFDDVYDKIMYEIEKIGNYREKQIEYEQSVAFQVKNAHLNNRSLALSNEIEDMDIPLRGYYEDLIQGKIGSSDFTLIKENIEKQLNAAKAELHKIHFELDHYQKNLSSNSLKVNAFLKYANANELTEDMYNCIVEKMLVYDTGLEIVLLNR